MNTYIVRQPILDRRKQPFAYDLRHHVDDDADRIFADVSGVIELGAITGRLPAFIPTSRKALVGGYASALPTALTVLDIDASIEPDEDVRDAIAKARRLDLRVCLSVSELGSSGLPGQWADLDTDVDFVRVRLSNVEPSKAVDLAMSLRGLGIDFIASDVETWQEFDIVTESGFEFAAGSFLQTPDVVVGKELPSTHANYLHLLSEIHESELNLDELEEIIKREVSLSFKLLRYINSSAFGVRSEVKSIRHALVLLGVAELRRFASLVGLAELSGDKPDELVFQSVVRGRLCEHVANHVGLGERAQELFLMGLLSNVDAIVDLPLEDVLERVPISDDVKAALLGESNRLADVLDCVAGYTMCMWDVYDDSVERLGLDRLLVPSLYLKALEWVNESGAADDAGVDVAETGTS